MSIRDDRINSGDKVQGCIMLAAICILAALPAIAVMLLVAMLVA